MRFKKYWYPPEFLFRIERDPAGIAPGTAYRVSGLELAPRLSFFLWSSIPDDKLLDLAEHGKLKEPADWIGTGGGEENRRTEGAWDGEVSVKSLAMSPLRPFFVPGGGRSGPSRAVGVARDGKNSRSPHKRRWLGIQSLGTESQNGNSGS